MALVTPHAWVASEMATSAELQTLTDAITQQQGGTPTTGGALDFAALRQTTLQAVANTTWTALTFTTEDIDVASGHSVVTNTSRYTAVQTGWFRCDATAAFAANATGGRAVRFAVNGTAVNASQGDLASPGVLSASVSTWAVVYMTAGQYVEAFCWQNSGGSLDTIVSGSAASRMTVKWEHA